MKYPSHAQHWPGEGEAVAIQRGKRLGPRTVALWLNEGEGLEEITIVGARK